MRAICLSGIVVLLAAQLPSAPAQSQEKPLAEAMQRRAQTTSVYRLNSEQLVKENLHPSALITYADRPRKITNATLWVYGTQGRPAALQKIEAYTNESRVFFCLASLATDRLKVNWHDGLTWESQQAGIQLESLPDAGQAARSETARLFQMKKLASRFDAELFDNTTDETTKMRRQSRPLYRYKDSKQGIMDGAIFGFSAYGTNPDLLLVVELHSQGVTRPTWHYAFARMTLFSVAVKLDKKPTWEVEAGQWLGAEHPHKYSKWLFFHESKPLTPRPE